MKTELKLMSELVALNTDWSRQDKELAAARAGLPDCDRQNEPAENERIQDRRVARVRELMEEAFVIDPETLKPGDVAWFWHDVNGQGEQWMLGIITAHDRLMVNFVLADFEDFFYPDDWQDGEVRAVIKPTSEP